MSALSGWRWTRGRIRRAGRERAPATRTLIDFINQHKQEFGVEPICEVLTSADAKIAPSTYYAAMKRPPSQRAVHDEQLSSAGRHARPRPDEDDRRHPEPVTP